MKVLEEVANVRLLSDQFVLFVLYQGKMDSAACMIEKAILANPSYAEAYNNLGILPGSPI